MPVGCARCGAEIPRVNGDLTAFCGACGLPRLRVSPDAVKADVAAATPDATHAVRPILDWAAALRGAAAVSVLGAIGPALLPGAAVSGSSGGISLLLMPLMVIALVSLYHRSRPRRDITPAIGGRLGAVLGLLVGAWVALIAGVVGFVQRYRYGSHAMDDLFRQSAENMGQRLQGSPMLPDAMRMAESPEFHAGSLIMGHVLSLLLLVFAGTVSGWMAGAVLRSRRQRMVR